MRDDVQFRLRLAQTINPDDPAICVGFTVDGVGPCVACWSTSVGAVAAALGVALSHKRDGIPLPPSMVHGNVRRAAVASVWAGSVGSYSVPVEFLFNVAVAGVSGCDCTIVGRALLLRTRNGPARSISAATRVFASRSTEVSFLPGGHTGGAVENVSGWRSTRSGRHISNAEHARGRGCFVRNFGVEK